MPYFSGFPFALLKLRLVQPADDEAVRAGDHDVTASGKSETKPQAKRQALIPRQA